ncbi:MAG: hypothetical protein HQL66_02910 [Magnetococcales bacterium]|nr:hypothetical protein [Magnetococcales bacterium]
MSTPDPRQAVRLLFLLVLLLYARVITCDWVNWDDTIYFANPHLQQGLSAASLRWALSDTDLVHQWIPITWLSILLDLTLFGDNPAATHGVNLLLHLANTVLLFTLLRRATGQPWPALFAAALFAVHPQHVEAVAWATERKELLAALFGLISLHLYVIFVMQRADGRSCRNRRCFLPLLGSVGCYFLSLTAKPMWITLPFLLLLLDGWPLRRWQRPWGPLLAEKLAYLPVMIGILLVTFRVYETPSFAPDGVSIWQLLPQAVMNDLHYLTATFWPVDLAPLYPLPLAAPDSLRVAGAACVLLVLTGVALSQVRSRPWLLWGWLWFMGALLPVSGIIHAGRHATTDRFTYLPHMGLFAALAWEASLWAGRWRLTPRLLAGLAGGVLLVAAALSFNQIGIWQDSLSLWSRAIAVTRDNHYAHYMLAGLFMEERDLDRAEAEIQRALAILPGQVDYALLHADITYRRGGRAEALEQLRQLAIRHPTVPKIPLRMAMIHLREGSFTQALPLLQSIVASGTAGGLAPAVIADITEAEFNLGVTRAMLGEGEGARHHLARAFERQPWLRSRRCALLQALARDPAHEKTPWPRLAGALCP